MRDLIIIEINGENRIDSRLVAESLGIEHESFSKTLSTYQTELEELGVFRSEIGKPPRGSSGGRPGKYVMLNEDQAIFAATLSRNTKQVVEFKLQLTKAFAEARARLATHQSSRSAIPFNKDVQQRCIANEKLLPQGYWCVVNEMYKEALVVIPFQKELKDWALPDGSCGKLWRNHCKATEINISQSVQIPLWVPNLKMPTDVWIYSYDLLDTFRGWLQIEYASYYETSYSPPRLIGAEQIEKPKKRGWLR